MCRVPLTRLRSGSVVFRAEDLRPQDCLVQAELAVEFPDGVRLREHVYDGVNAIRLLVDLVGEAPTSPDVHLVDASAPGLDDREELVQRRVNCLLLEAGIENDHHLVTAHDRNTPPLD